MQRAVGDAVADAAAPPPCTNRRLATAGAPPLSRWTAHSLVHCRLLAPKAPFLTPESAMNLEICHTTTYQYDREVQLMPHLLYLRPRENPLLQVSQFRLTIEPASTLYWMRDDFDNLPASAHFSNNSSILQIRSDFLVQTEDAPPFDFLVRDYASHFPFAYEPLHRFNLGIYLSPPDMATQTALRNWLLSRLLHPPADTVGWLAALNQALFRNLSYLRRDEPGIQSPLETIGTNSGACRDYASLFVACARTLGLAARFVSGYVFDANMSSMSPGDMHAWAEVFLPGAGWRGLDPTHGIFCHNTYVPVAHAVVAESINPIQGAFYSTLPAAAQLSTNVRIQQLHSSAANA